MERKVILVGNPNTGKTTLYNTLTKSFEKAMNWHGVTVGVKGKEINLNKNNVMIYDLPGLYSIDGFSKEEKLASEFLKNNKDALIVNICDASSLERNIKLTLELIGSGYDVILAVNMIGKKHPKSYLSLEKILNIKIVQIDARSERGIKNLKQEISNYINQKTQNTTKYIKKHINYDDLKKYFAEYSKINHFYLTDKIDKFILNKIVFFSVFVILLLLVFYITFGPIGQAFSGLINQYFNHIVGYLRKIILCLNINSIIIDCIFDGVLGSVLTVLSFVPQIVLLMFFLNILEDTGLMSRIAFMFDGYLRKVGLSGKALFSLMMGFGCTTSAVVATRNLENVQLRKRTVLLLPFMSCSAKLPVFLVIASLFFTKYKFLIVFALYLFSIFLSLVFALIYKKILPDSCDFSIFEIPKYRFPNMKKILSDIWIVVSDFLIKIGSVIILFSSLLWFLQNFTLGFKYCGYAGFENSILYFVSSKLSFLFKPLGFASVGIIVSIILGVVAKEMVVVGLAMINGVAGGSLLLLSSSLVNPESICFFTPTSSIVFLIFVLLYSPCLSAVISIKNELGIKFAIYVFLAQFILSYFISLIIFLFISYNYFRIGMLLFFILDILICIVIILKRKLNCRRNCNACRKVCC